MELAWKYANIMDLKSGFHPEYRNVHLSNKHDVCMSIARADALLTSWPCVVHRGWDVGLDMTRHR